MKKNVINLIYQTEIIGGMERTLEKIDEVLNINFNTYYLKSYGNINNLKIKGQLLSLNENNNNSLIKLIYLLFKRAYEYKKYCKKYDIKYCISYGDDISFSNILSKLLFNNKSIIIIMLQSSLSIYKGRKTYIVYKYFFKYLFRKADIVITGSEEMKKSVIKNGLKNVYTIYNPLDLNEINKLKSEPINDKVFNNGKKTFITIGRLSHVKNIEFIINTFNDFNSKYSDYQLIIIGDGELKDELDNYINTLENKNNIHLLGFRDNVYSYLYKSDFFIFSSFNEGFGRVLIEANACRLPVITHDFKYGAKEIIRNNDDVSKCNSIEIHENGILTPYMDKEKFLEGMELIINTKFDKNKILENIKKYDIENFKNSWEEILSE